MRISKKDLETKKLAVYEDIKNGLTQKEITLKRNCSGRLVSQVLNEFEYDELNKTFKEIKNNNPPGSNTNTNTITNTNTNIRKIILPVTLPRDYQDHLIHALNKVAKDQKRRFKSEEIKKHLREAHIID